MTKKYVHISDSDFKDIIPCNCGEEYCKPTFIRKNSIFPYYIFHFIFRGSGVFIIDGVEHKVEKGQISVVPPNKFVTYYTDAENPWHYSWIGFKTGIKLPLPDNKLLINLPQAEQIFHDMASSEKLLFGRELYLCSKIFELLTLLSQVVTDSSDAAVEFAKQAKVFIENNYNKQISLTDIADSIMISKSYLCSLFKDITGVSPYKYLTDVRLKRAFDLISLYNQPVSTVAADVGYPDIYSFSKAFKKYYGAPPSSFMPYKTP